MDSATVHRIYSMSKAITSVALLTLYEQAKFQLDDPLEKYLPEFADPQVFTAGSAALPTKRHANQSITPRHLMTHTHRALPTDSREFRTLLIKCIGITKSAALMTPLKCLVKS